MVAKLGSKKSHHFAHKANTQSCSSETYLHKLAKTFLMQKFQTGAFEIEMKRYYLCVEAESCLFNGNCRQSDWKKYDLKDHYDSCVEEQSVDGFRADILIAGDTLFREEIGRCDLPTGSFEDIKNSIKEKLFKLDPNVKVFTGHGDNTTIGHEKEFNAYFGLRAIY